MRRRQFQKEWILVPIVVASIIIGIVVSNMVLNGSSTNTTSLISGNAIEKILPKTANTSAGKVCSAIICSKAGKEVYCPLSTKECSIKYSACRTINCETETAKKTTTQKSNSTMQKTASNNALSNPGDDVCTAEYNDCYDNGKPVVCKGDYEQCCSSFQNCVCGMSDTTEEQATPDIDLSNSGNCTTGVFRCNKQVMALDGTIATSTVTCKSDFRTCSATYGNCACGNSSLTDFPTQYVGDTQDNYWCEYLGKKIPCYMVPDHCTLKKNTCFKDNDVKVTCDGSFDYCNKLYDGNCVCGIEIISSGFMTKSSD